MLVSDTRNFYYTSGTVVEIENSRMVRILIDFLTAYENVLFLINDIKLANCTKKLKSTEIKYSYLKFNFRAKKDLILKMYNNILYTIIFQYFKSVQ